MTVFNERADVRWARLNSGERRGGATTIGASAPAKEMLGDLYRLIDALDRRVPRLERAGEAQIARDASSLRERAMSIIHQIEAAVETAPE